MNAPLPPNEAQRLKALREYGVMDTPPEREFDEITALAAEICEAPIALIALIDESRQWFKSRLGLVLEETPREQAFCAHALTGSELLIVPDALKDQRFAESPFVRGDPRIRFYAGAPLVTPGGETLGSLCVIDRVPRQLSERQQRALRVLSQHVMTQLELRRQLRAQRQAAAERDRLFNLSLDMLCVAGFDGRFEQVNPAWTECLGWSAAELMSRPWLDFVHPDDHASTIRAGEALFEGKLVRGFENRYRCKDGSYRWLSWNVQPLPDARQVISVARDVTAQRQASEQLRLLEASVARLNDIVIITEAEPLTEPGPRIVYVNEAFTRRTGYTREEVIGRSPRFLQGPKTQLAASDRIDGALKKNQPIREEFINYTKTGEAFWLEVEITPITDAAGRPTHFVAIERDITERKRTEEALRTSESRLRTIFESEPECVQIVSVDGRLLEMNPAGLRMIEADEGSQVFGLPVMDLVHPEDRGAFQQLHVRSAAGGTGQLQFRVIGLKQTERWMETHSTPLRESDGTITSVLSVTRDITERKQSEEALAIKTETLAAVTEALVAYVGGDNWREAMGRLLRCALSQTQSEYGFIGVVVGDSQLRVLTHEGIVWDKVLNREFYEQALRSYEKVGYLEFTNFNNLFGRAITTGQVVIANLPDHDPRSGGRPSGHPPMHSFLGVPIFAGQQVTGLVALANRPGGYSEAEQRRIETLVQHAGGLCTSYRQREAALVVEQERVKAEEALRVSEERFRLLTKATNDVIWDWDLTTNLLRWNEGYEKLFGYRRDEVDPSIKSWTDFLHPEDWARVTDSIGHVIDHGGEGWTDEYRFRCKDGRYTYVLDRGHIIRDGAGKAIRMIGGMTDLTERRRIEVEMRQQSDRLRASEEQYRMIFGGNPQPMWVFDFETLFFVAVNVAAVRHYGYAEAEFLAMRITDIRTPAAAADLLHELKGLGTDGKRSTRTQHRKKDGTTIDVEITSDSISFAGRPARLVLTHDVTERLRAEREAARATRALQVLSRCNEALIRADSERGLLDAICTIAVEIGGARMAWVGYAQDDAGKTIAPQAHAGVEEGYLAEIKVSWAEDEPNGRGPAGQTIRSGRPVVVPDFSQEEDFRPWLGPAQARGYRGVIGLPLKDRDRTFGLFVLYLAEVREVPGDELILLRELADDFAFGILNLRARLEGRRTHEAVLTMARGISTRSGEAFFEELTQRMVEALGAHSGFIAEFDPLDHSTVHTLSAIVAGKPVPNFAYPLAGTPCEQLDRADVWVIPRDARRFYPQSHFMAENEIEAYVGAKLTDAAGRAIGLLFVQFQQPLAHEEFVASILKIFAARASSELERQNSDSQMREQAALIDQARDAIIVRDLEHCIIFWNKGAERLYGWSADEAVGRHLHELLWVDAAKFEEADRAVRATGEWNGEIGKTAKSTAVLTVYGRSTLLRDAQGKPKAILNIDTDITERKAMEQQFLRAQRMESIGTLAGGIAHDLNNLLAPISMGVGLLRQFEPSAASLPVLDIMERSAKRGSDLVKQVLSFARGVEGSRVALQIRHIIREVESIAENTFPKNISIELDVASDVWLVMGDPTQMNQVLLNLCVNARDAMPDGGRLALTVGNVEIDQQYAVMNRSVTAGRYVVMQVTDNGHGMPKEIIDRIFEPFYTTKELGKGTGLGLSTVLGIVRSHGGFVNVYSQPGKGSTFKVYLPAHTVAGAADGHDAGPEKFPRGNGELILVVDDEPSILFVTGQTLRTFGYKVVTAEDGAQAIGLYAQQRDEIAAVLTDMMMPVMDGPALIAALRRINPKVRIIAASGLIANGNAVGAANTGVKHFLAKPYSADAMLSLLKQLLSE